MSESKIELEVLQRLVPELEAEGYQVFLHPNRMLVPEFLAQYTPDAIARRSDKNVAIEIASRSAHTEKRIETFARLFAAHPEWEFRVIWIDSASAEKDLQIQNRTVINEKINEVSKLLNEDHPSPALLLAWATLEAVARSLIPHQFLKPQTPGRLVQVLAMEGCLTPDEADFVRSLVDKRNKLIHGELQTEITTDEVSRFANLLRSISEDEFA